MPAITRTAIQTLPHRKRSGLFRTRQGEYVADINPDDGKRIVRRPDFIVNWVGGHIHEDDEEYRQTERIEYARLQERAELRADYVATLRDTLTRWDESGRYVSGGLWMTVPRPEDEALQARMAELMYTRPMTCFSEARLPEAQTLTRRHGLLGFGFTRRFVEEREGGPVHYVSNRATVL